MRVWSADADHICTGARHLRLLYEFSLRTLLLAPRAVVEPLQLRSLHALSETYSALAADDARVTSCRRVRHPETLLACAMASADVCGRNLTAARAL